MTPAEAFFGPADFERGRWGWAVVNLPGGEGTDTYRRATTVAGYLDDKQGLIEWTAAMVAFGMAKSPALMANFQLLDWHDDKGKVKEMLGKAKDLGGGSEAADTGTAFHKVVEKLHLGHEIDRDNLPEGFAETLSAYEKFLADWKLKPLGSEVKVVDDEYRIAGTADLALTVAEDIETPFGSIPAGAGFIADVKTGYVSDYSGMSMGIQLGIYSHGHPYNVTSGERMEWPVDNWLPGIGLILKIDIKAHSVTPWWLNLNAAYELVPVAMQVSRLRSVGKKFIQKAEYVAAAPEPAAEAAPEKADPLPPLEVVNVEDVAPAPAKEEAPAPEPAPAAEKTRADLIAEEADECPNVGQARELYKKWRRDGATADELKIIATRAAELGASPKN